MHPEGWIVLSDVPLQCDLCIVVGVAADASAALRLAKAGVDHVVVWPGPHLEAVLLTAARSVQREASAATYQAAFRLSPVWQEVTDAKVRLVDVSEGFERVTGIQRKDAIGRTPAQLFRGGTHGGAYYEGIEHAVNTTGRWRGDLLGRRGNGSLAVMDATISGLLRGSECVSQFAVKIASDDRLRGSLSSWIADRVESAWVLVRSNGLIIEGSNHDVLGRPPETVVGHLFSSLNVPLSLPPHGVTRQVDVWRDGIAWEVTATGRLVGDVDLVLVQFDDVTQRKAKTEALDTLARQLADARDEALAADRAKSAFLAAMSHDLRTPLNAIIGYGELLAEEFDGLANSQDLQRILDSGHRLLGLVDELLDLARIESGSVQAEPALFQVRPLLDEVVSTLAIAAAGQGKRLVVVAPDIVVDADRTRVCRILCNLTSNAVKYATPGTITVGLEGSTFYVEDEGPGLTDVQRREIFEPFLRLQSTGSGVGLGLALCKRLAGVLGGELDVVGSTSGGSRFELRLDRSILRSVE